MIQSLPELRQQFITEQKRFQPLPADDPRSPRPLSLEQNKKQAKQLLKSLRNSEEWPRAESHPAPDSLTVDNIKLANAQAIIAREHGFKSWTKLKRHIESEEIAQKAVMDGTPTALDAQKRTLHIRCGNDVMYKLAIAGFTGDFLCFADPYIQGPVPAEQNLDRFIRIRGDFIADNNWRKREQAYNDLLVDYHALDSAREYARVACWFEHDAYDVLIFIKLLDYFSDPEKRPDELCFLCIDHYPGVKRFNGIGQLPAQAMRLLWQQFAAINEAHLLFGKLCWEAYTDTTPQALSQLIKLESPPLPAIMPALKRHIQELPWQRDGLSLTERLTLTILAERGPQDGSQLFYHWYTTHYEPLVFMGDSSYWIVLDQLAQARHPAIELVKDTAKPIDWHISLTDFGRELLSGKTHWMAHNDYDRWFGGVHNHSDSAIWYWDEVAGDVILA